MHGSPRLTAPCSSDLRRNAIPRIATPRIRRSEAGHGASTYLAVMKPVGGAERSLIDQESRRPAWSWNPAAAVAKSTMPAAIPVVATRPVPHIVATGITGPTINA